MFGPGPGDAIQVGCCCFWGVVECAAETLRAGDGFEAPTEGSAVVTLDEGIVAGWGIRCLSSNFLTRQV